MAKYGIPGVAVGITISGKPYVFSYGVRSTDTRKPVTHDTLFEIGSVTKTFTATLASYAQVSGRLSLSDRTSEYLSALRGSDFGNVTLLDLATHTPGGLPLQVPDNIRNNDELIQYFQDWRPTYKAGTFRTYANPGIGTLGLITAKSLGQDFATLIERRLFPALGMRNSYINVPAGRVVDYAQGYTRADGPARMATAVLSSEAYGINATAPDMVRFMEANLNLVRLDKTVQRAIADTHIGYFKAGPMTQDLIWEEYDFPVALRTLLDGNSLATSSDPTPVTAFISPQEPREDVWINKTGSTNGFAAYVAFIPKERLGVVILANKNYPIDERVTAAYHILTALADRTTAHSK